VSEEALVVVRAGALRHERVAHRRLVTLHKDVAAVEAAGGHLVGLVEGCLSVGGGVDVLADLRDFAAMRCG